MNTPSPRIQMDIDSVTIFNSPILSVKTLTKVFLKWTLTSLKFALKHIFVLILIIGILGSLKFIEGPHSKVKFNQTVKTAEEIFWFIQWWLLLGVASSIGLGTGLHTFVLYLGPYIAKVTLVAYQCNYIPNQVPSRWSFESFQDCPKPNQETIGIFSIILAVQLEAFLWGLGTALGQLPPYFIARAARQSNKNPEQLEQLEDLNQDTFSGRSKRFIMKSLKNHGFITVLLCASIPNPLFDVAGLLCGHFGISLWVFLGAAIIGKAFIKVHIQMFFTIILMGQHHIEYLLSLIEAYIPSMNQSLTNMLQKHKMLLHHPELHQSEQSFIQKAWQAIIILMISFFVVSIFNSLVRRELNNQSS